MTSKQWIDFRYQFDQGELDQKMNFNDFLIMLLRESFFRDTLAEAQIFKQSSRRFVYADEIKLITQQHLALLGQMKACTDTDKEVKLPSFSYLIEHMIMFEFNRQTFLLVSLWGDGDC